MLKATDECGKLRIPVESGALTDSLAFVFSSRWYARSSKSSAWQCGSDVLVRMHWRCYLIIVFFNVMDSCLSNSPFDCCEISVFLLRGLHVGALNIGSGP